MIFLNRENATVKVIKMFLFPLMPIFGLVFIMAYHFIGVFVYYNPPVNYLNLCKNEEKL